MNPSLFWQIIVAVLGAAFTVGAVSRSLSNGIDDLKRSLEEVKDEVRAQGVRIGSLEVRVAVLENPFKMFMQQQLQRGTGGLGA
jgi:hypothetical protein